MKRTASILVALGMLVGSSAWAADGAAVFKEKCAKCHGESGASDTSAGKSMKVPALAGDAKVAGKSEDEIVKELKESAKHKQPVKGLSDDDLKAAAGVAKKLASGK